jgi:RimJ/RimL family protein N-acetyltransferase
MTPPEPWRPPSPLPDRLETERLVMRWWTPEDAPAQLAALDAGPPGRAAMIPWLLPWVREDNRDLAQCIFHIERFRRARAEPDADDFVLGIFDRQSGDVVGGTGFHRIDCAHRRGEIGYWIRADRHGQGLCTEAVRALIGWGFGPWGFHKIVIHCAAGNIGSRRVPEKLGVRLEAQLRRDRWIEGRGWEDTLIFGVLADEWAR